MENTGSCNEIEKLMACIEYHPVVLEQGGAGIERYTKLPLAKMSAIGTAFGPLAAAFQNIVTSNGHAGSGLYRVTVPKGGHLAEFKDGTGYLGAVLNEHGAVGGGQARLTPFAWDPAMLCMAAVLLSIDKKLDSIQEMQREILDFLKQKEKAKLRGDLNFLSDIMNSYQYNWTNEKYKNNHHIKVLDIKQDAEQNILFHREQIEENLKKDTFIHSDRYVKDKLAKIQEEFREYQLALYVFAFSSFLEVMLLENFTATYLDSVAHKIEGYAFRYRELYTESYNHIEGYAKSSLQAHLLGGLANINKVAGKSASKIPLAAKAQIDETLADAGSRLEQYSSKKTGETMAQLAGHQSSGVHLFVENIKTVKKVYNQPIEVLFDDKHVYLDFAEQA